MSEHDDNDNGSRRQRPKEDALELAAFLLEELHHHGLVVVPADANEPMRQAGSTAAAAAGEPITSVTAGSVYRAMVGVAG